MNSEANAVAVNAGSKVQSASRRATYFFTCFLINVPFQQLLIRNSNSNVSKSVISNMEDLIVATMAIAMVICTHADYHDTLSNQQVRLIPS